MKSLTPSEIEIQQSFRKRLYYAAPEIKIVAVPNAAKRSQWAAAQAKREGLAKGFPDVICIAPCGLIAFIEFKSAKGRVSEPQTEWIELLNRYTFPAAIARSAEAAIAFLRSNGFQIRGQAA